MPQGDPVVYPEIVTDQIAKGKVDGLITEQGRDVCTTASHFYRLIYLPNQQTAIRL